MMTKLTTAKAVFFTNLVSKYDSIKLALHAFPSLLACDKPQFHLAAKTLVKMHLLIKRQCHKNSKTETLDMHRCEHFHVTIA
jgi:hypothetical protein